MYLFVDDNYSAAPSLLGGSMKGGDTTKGFKIPDEFVSHISVAIT